MLDDLHGSGDDRDDIDPRIARNDSLEAASDADQANATAQAIALVKRIKASMDQATQLIDHRIYRALDVLHIFFQLTNHRRETIPEDIIDRMNDLIQQHSSSQEATLAERGGHEEVERQALSRALGGVTKYQELADILQRRQAAFIPQVDALLLEELVKVIKKDARTSAGESEMSVAIAVAEANVNDLSDPDVLKARLLIEWITHCLHWRDIAIPEPHIPSEWEDAVNDVFVSHVVPVAEKIDTGNITESGEITAEKKTVKQSFQAIVGKRKV